MCDATPPHSGQGGNVTTERFIIPRSKRQLGMQNPVPLKAHRVAYQKVPFSRQPAQNLTSRFPKAGCGPAEIICGPLRPHTKWQAGHGQEAGFRINTIAPRRTDPGVSSSSLLSDGTGGRERRVAGLEQVFERGPHRIARLTRQYRIIPGLRA